MPRDVPVAGKSRENESSRNRRLEKRLAEALTREVEALEQRTVTSEILQVISSSPSDVLPVFDTIVRNVARLCEATHRCVYRFEGELLAIAARAGFPGHRPDFLL